MAIKRKQSQTYISDTGKEFELDQMQSSHIMNVLAHHIKQREGLRVASGFVAPPHHFPGWERLLDDTIKALAEELATRDPDTFVEPERNFNNDRSY